MALKCEKKKSISKHSNINIKYSKILMHPQWTIVIILITAPSERTEIFTKKIL
jgi:hypothetical protein